MAAKYHVQEDIRIQEISHMLLQLSVELQNKTESSKDVHPGHSERKRPSVIRSEDNGVRLNAAEGVYRERRRLERLFGPDGDLLHGPVFDILLYIFICEQRHMEVSVSSVCHATSAPQTTALRYIVKLTDRGLLARADDMLDGRRQLLTLTEKGRDLTLRSLETVIALSAGN